MNLTIKPTELKYLRLAWMINIEIENPKGEYEKELNKGIKKLKKRLSK